MNKATQIKLVVDRDLLIELDRWRLARLAEGEAVSRPEAVRRAIAALVGTGKVGE